MRPKRAIGRCRLLDVLLKIDTDQKLEKQNKLILQVFINRIIKTFNQGFSGFSIPSKFM